MGDTTTIAVPADPPREPGAVSVLACGDWLVPVPADSEHDGWICVQPVGHLPTHDHRAEDDTSW
ncbi:hypothetical protein [Actinokineospora enzanensis]|uniref:hypothetical protein n=1 Tax=Actinokineospora enzanensis TaxID=155975 RepID=UPI000368CCBB|nr:hypothetical protein [Actinokineospora enzanensis]